MGLKPTKRIDTLEGDRVKQVSPAQPSPVTKSSKLRPSTIISKGTLGSEPTSTPKVISSSSTLKPTKTMSVSKNKTPRKPSVTHVTMSSKAPKHTSTDTTPNNSIHFNPVFIEDKVPGYPTFYYIEVSNLLKNMDIDNYTSIYNLGEGTQLKVNKLSNNLMDIQTYSDRLNEIKKRMYKEGWTFGINVKDVKEIYDAFNKGINEILKETQTEFNELTKLREEFFSNLDRLYFYEKFLKFFVDELISRQILSVDRVTTSPLSSRIISINSSITIVNQLKQSLDIRYEAIKLELENLKYYKTSKASLDILLSTNKKTFTSHFKELLSK